LHVANLGRSDIRLVPVAEKRPLGALRNISVDRANGPLLCQWDDDDLHHETRLEYQVSELLARRAGAVYLKNTLQIYWLGWGDTKLRGHPATLLF
jgi:glycosyltransferase involved in cell wall biosynthesis